MAAEKAMVSEQELITLRQDIAAERKRQRMESEGLRRQVTRATAQSAAMEKLVAAQQEREAKLTLQLQQLLERMAAADHESSQRRYASLARRRQEAAMPSAVLSDPVDHIQLDGDDESMAVFHYPHAAPSAVQ
jgi:hypothetical protein